MVKKIIPIRLKQNRIRRRMCRNLSASQRVQIMLLAISQINYHLSQHVRVNWLTSGTAILKTTIQPVLQSRVQLRLLISHLLKKKEPRIITVCSQIQSRQKIIQLQLTPLASLLIRILCRKQYLQTLVKN